MTNSTANIPTVNATQKFLINADFKAIRKGAYVSADVEAGEFILDTSDFDFSKGQMEELAEANKIKVNKRLNVKEYKTELVAKLNELEIAEVNKMNSTEIVKGIVEAGFAADKSDDEMLVEIIQAGVKFKEAGKLFAKCAEDGGFRVNAAKRKAAVGEILDEAEFAPEHYDEVQSMVDHIVAEVAGSEEKDILKAIKSWAKVNEVTLPKKVKEPKTKMADSVLKFMAENVTDVTVEAITEFISTTKPEFDSEKVAKMAGRFFKYVEFARMANDVQSVDDDAQSVDSE